MARSTPDEIRRRMAKRKTARNSPNRRLEWPEVDGKLDFDYIPPSVPGNSEGGHPLFKKEVFFFKILASILLFLVIAIIFRSPASVLEPARAFVKSSMDKEFQFAAVSAWYQDKFGKPLALLPFTEKQQAGEEKIEPDQKGAVPVTGRLLENFEKNGQGIMIETGKGVEVQTIDDGIVTFAGVKEDLGKTVIVQHSDQSETWYGNLDEIKVDLYQFIDKREVVGTVSESSGEDKTKGQYYFAVKEGEAFIDPIQVIRFE